MRRLLVPALVLVALSASAQSPSATGKSVMLSGEILRNNEYLTSPHGKFVMIMQSDGNFCEYFGSSPSNFTPGATWCSNTARPTGQYSVQLHVTNNFCVTTGNEWGQGPALWCTNAVGSGSPPAFASLDDDGNFVIQSGTPAAPGAPLWQSGKVVVSTSASGKNVMLTGEILRSAMNDYLANNGFVLVMQKDGNLCEYVGSTSTSFKPGAIWCSNTTGPGGHFSAQMHSTHNFCVTTGEEWGRGPALWCTNQIGSGSGPVQATLNGDGNFLIQEGSRLLWQTGIVFAQVSFQRPLEGATITLPSGEVCPPSCDPKLLRVGTPIQLSTQAPSDYKFQGWTGLCANQPNPCRITVPAYTTANVIGAAYGRDRNVVISTACPTPISMGILTPPPPAPPVPYWFPPCTTALCLTFDGYGASFKACDGGPSQTVLLTASGSILESMATTTPDATFRRCACADPNSESVGTSYASNFNGTACSMAGCVWIAEANGILHEKSSATDCMSYGDAFNWVYWRIKHDTKCLRTFTVTPVP